MACVRCYRPDSPVLLAELVEVNRDQLADHNGEMPSVCRQCSQSLTQAKTFFEHWGFDLQRRDPRSPDLNGARESPEGKKAAVKP